MMLSSPHLVGVDGGDENRIYVTVVSQEEQTAQDELPAPKDSAPSMPRQADKTKADERTEKPENELHEPKGVEKPEATQEENSEDMPILASSVPDPIRDRPGSIGTLRSPGSRIWPPPSWIWSCPKSL